MNYKQNSIINQSNQPAKSYFKRSRVFPPRSEFSDASLSKSNILKSQIQALIDKVPQDQAFIQNYIEELKSKLMQLKLSPNKKKNNNPLQSNQNEQHKYYQNTKPKSRAKIIKNYNQIQTTRRSTEFSRKSFNDHRLLDLKQVRDQVKRLKRNTAERRVVTQKENHRYEHQQEENQYENNQFNRLKSNYKIRSNTQEVIRSTKNPARMYRYSSLKKTKLAVVQILKNNLADNQLINSNSKINKYSHSQPQSPSKDIRSPKQVNIKKRAKLQIQKSISKQIKPDKIQLEKEDQINQQIEDLSTIMAKKQTLNFLGDSCVAIKEQLETYKQSTAKFLDFLDWKTKQLKDVFSNCKQKKRKWELEKLSKIFPKGFFI